MKIISRKLFDIAWLLFLVSQMVSITAWYALEQSPVKVYAYKGVALVSCAILTAVIVINLIMKVYSFKVFVCYAVLGMIFALSWWFSQDFMLIWMFLMFMAVYNQSGRRVITISLIVQGLSLFLTVLSSQCIQSLDYIFNEEGRNRHGLGYSWTTNAATLFFFFAIQYIFIRKSKLRIWECVTLECANVFFFIMTDSKLPFILGTLILLFFACQTFYKNHWNVLGRIKVIYCLMPVIICLGTFVLYFVLPKESFVYIKINELINNRLAYGNLGVETYGLSLFGRPIAWNGLSITNLDMIYWEYLYVDCSYVKALIEFGPVFLAAVLAIYASLIRKSCQGKDYWLVFIAIAVLLHSFTEPRLIDMTFNVIPILAFAAVGESAVVYEKGFLKEIFR